MARYLRDRGVDAEVLLFDCEQEHFHPSCDTYSLNFMQYVRQLEWGHPSRLSSTASAKTRRDLERYDVLIGCGSAPAYLHKARMALDIFVPYGDDLWALTFYPRVLPFPKRVRLFFAPVYHQRRGIGLSKVIHMAKCIVYEGQIRKYHAGAERWFEGFPMVYAPEYSLKNLPMMMHKTHWGSEFQKLRSESDLMLFSAVRHVWKTKPSDPNGKGTDKLLRGLGLFLKRKKDIRVKLISFEYGRDVLASKALIAELGIQDSVAWFPKMYRKDLMAGLLMSDIACAEVEKSVNASGAIYEALVAEKPLLMHRIDADYASDNGDIYPVMNANDPESIAARLEGYVTDSERFKEMGRQGREWYEKEVVEKSLTKYLDYIQSKIHGKVT